MTASTLTTANQHYRNGNFAEALRLYRELALETPQDPEIWHVIATLNAQCHEWENAQLAIDTAISLTSKEPALYNTAGNIAMKSKEFSRAAEHYKKAIRLNPHYTSAQNNLGNAYYQQKKFKSAEIAYQKALEINPKQRDALFNQAILLKRTQRINEAIDLLQANHDVIKTHPKALGQLGQWLLAQKEFIKAEKILSEQIRLFPDDTDAYHDLGHALLERGEIEQALLWLEKGLQLNPKHPQIHHNLASAYLKANKLQDAMTGYLQQLQVNPQLETYYNIGVLLMYQERQRESIHYYEQALALEPRHLATHLNLGAVYLRLNEHDMALRHYQNAADISPNDPEIDYVMAALSKNTQPERAPTRYTEHLFNEYALHYDRHLTGKLRYDLPEQMSALCIQELGDPKAQYQILDLGCGSGLLGKAFEPFSQRLVGVDVAESMLAEAKNKRCYHTLIRDDIESVEFSGETFDLILAADVLSYLGDLNPIFTQVQKWLGANGHFMFSVERGTEVDYQLQKTMRYQHRRDYIESLIETNGFTTVCFNNVILRQQNKKNVEGYLVLLGRNT